MNYELLYNAVVLQCFPHGKRMQRGPVADFAPLCSVFQCNLTASPLLAVTSKQSCTDLQKEKEEVCTGAEDALKTLKERHKEELVQLEDRCAIHPHPLSQRHMQGVTSCSHLPAFILTQTVEGTRRSPIRMKSDTKSYFKVI